MKIWAKTDGEVKEGKYLVVRRDGTIPDWKHFVIGGNDLAGPAGLRAYADKARALYYDPEYCDSIYEVADDFEKQANVNLFESLATGAKGADPDAGPHRRDNPAIISILRGEGDLTKYRGPSIMKAKPLEWKEPSGYPTERLEYLILVANGIGGKYHITQEYNGVFLLWSASDKFVWAATSSTIDEAKEKAEANWQKCWLEQWET